MPRIVIAGGTGFLGRPLAESLAAAGHEVVVLSRSAPGTDRTPAADAAARPRRVIWTPNGESGPWAAELDGAAAVINLAGESLAGTRWTAAHKRRILDSRVRATRSLVAAVGGAATAPAVFVSQSAVGYYGARGDEILDEHARAGSDFLAGVCVQWEAEAGRAATDRARLVCLRTGLVLERDGGPLPPMLPPFWFGAGGPVGSGRQYWSWIHRTDWIALVQWAIATPSAAGAINATAPHPVTNREFARALGHALRRPAIMPAPAFAVRLLLGEMADPLVLTGQRVVPAQAERLGFTFRYHTVADAFGAIFRR